MGAHRAAGQLFSPKEFPNASTLRGRSGSSKARRSPQPGDHAHTAMRSGGHRRLRSARAGPPLAPSSSFSGRPPHKLHTHGLRRAVYTHTQAHT